MAKSVGVQCFTSLPGLDAIEKAAKKRAITLKAVKAGAKLVQRAAKGNAPRRSGALKQSIGTKGVKGSRGKTLAFAVIGARMKVEKTFKGKLIRPGKYAHLAEKGTRPHSLIKREKGAVGKALRALKIAAGLGKKHPGARAHPFLKPALDSCRVAAQSAMLQTLAVEIQKEIAKASARAFETLKTFKVR